MAQLLDRPHAAVRAALAAGAPLFIPVNPVEFHGPHLSLHNDHLLSVGLAPLLHAALWPEHPLLITRDLELGVDPCPGPGTRLNTFPEVRKAVLDAARGALEMGAKTVVFMTFHGSPLHAVALDVGVRWLRKRGVVACDPFNAVTAAIGSDALIEEAEPALAHLGEAEAAAVRAGLGLDYHAGFFETSVALHLAPESVDPRYAELPPCPTPSPIPPLKWLASALQAVGAKEAARQMTFAAYGLGWYRLRPFPGYTNRPSAASAEAGRVFTDLIIARQVAVLRDAQAGRETPPPLLGWLRWVTFGGRVGSPRVPTKRVALPLQ